ncbi:MAG: hypothetical protein ACLSCR_13750 [Akkermansia sp.]
MWNDLCHGLSILSAAFAIACRSWGFWMSVGGVAGLAAVYVWWRRRMVLWAFSWRSCSPGRSGDCLLQADGQG